MQKHKDVDHQYVKMNCTPNHFSEYKCFGPHNKPHGVHR